MKKTILITFALTIAYLNAMAENSQPVQIIKDLGLNEYICQYKILATPEVPYNVSENFAIFAVDKKTAYTVCLSRIDASVFGNDGEQTLGAYRTKWAPGKFVKISEVLLAEVK